MNFTPSQQKAIDLKGDSLLVSAAAGAGKTAVLTARVLRILSDETNPCDADRLMILTFTNAAAEEMRKRITDALRTAVREHPESSHLKRQLSLIPCAKICTIDSACLDIVRQNFSALGLDPQFSVMEQNRGELMKADALDDFIEELYERADRDADIMAVIKYFADGKTDSKLYSALDKGSEFLLREPWADEYIDKVCSVPENRVFASIDGLQKLLCSDLSDLFSEYKTLLVTAESIEHEKLLNMYTAETEGVRLTLEACKKGDFDAAVSASRAVTFDRHPACPKKDVDKERWSDCKDKRTELRDRFTELCDEFLYADGKTVLEDRRATLPVIRKYLELCNELNGILLEKRKKLRLMSFDDIEKYALSLLVKDSSGEKTELAYELSDSLDEIIVDEYQDCNRLQETIFSALSRDGKNVFTVGDVKQSIYGFRGAEPSLFIQKQRNSVIPDEDVLTAPSKLNLSENFRSHPKILDFVNSVFDPLMTPARGGIDYVSEHRLQSGGLYGDSTAAGVDITLVLPDGKPNVLSKAEMEAKSVAQKIKSIIGNVTVYDIKQNRERTVRPEDIAILMSAPKKSGSIYEKALEKEGIGCINNNPSEKYLDTSEVRDLLSYLQVIDNPYNDIPLVTLMYSDYFGFTAEELGALRAKNKRSLFYDAVRDYAKTDKKTAAFIERIESLRALSLTTDVYGIISAVYESSGVLLRLASKEGGDSARANLLMLADFASEFEASRYRGLFAFINYILKLIEKDSTVPAAKLRKSDGCVNILSIHRSKGLEYPVVFVVNTGDALVRNNTGEVILTQDIAGGKVKDGKNHRLFSSLYRNTALRHMREEELYEDMRLLYVALTRACSRLYITACCGADEFIKSVRTAYNAGETPTDSDVFTSPTFLKWMLFSLIKSKNALKMLAFADLPALSHGDTEFTVNIEVGSESEGTETVTLPASCQFVDTERVKRMIERKYAFESDTLIPAKLSVSEIKTMHTAVTAPKTPRFLQGGVEGRDRGNATHAFLQYCDFAAITDEASLDAEIDRLTKDEFISETDSKLVERDKILRFLLSDTMKDLSENAVCRKEERFLFGVPANEILDTDSCEPVTVQGIIDCLYVKDGKAVIVDYKTDRVKDAQTLVERYSVQLDMYEKALMTLEGLETSKKLIYSFCLESFIEL